MRRVYITPDDFVGKVLPGNEPSLILYASIRNACCQKEGRLKQTTQRLIVLGVAMYVGLAVSLCGGESDFVKLKDSGEQPVAGKEHHYQRWIRLSNAGVEITIYYCISTNKDEPFGDASVSQITINYLLSAPASFFNVIGQGTNRLTLARQPFRVELLQRQMEKKGVRIIWDLPDGKVDLILLLNANDDKLYGRFRVDTPGSYTVAQNLYPGGYCPNRDDRDRWVYTGRSDEPHGGKIMELGISGWLLAYDRKLDPESAKGMGAAGYVWAAAPGTKVGFTCGEYCSSFIADCAPDAKGFDFIFWPFMKYANEEAKQVMAQEGNSLAQRLAAEQEQLFGGESKINIRKPGPR
jgi:hypothetical protein